MKRKKLITTLIILGSIAALIGVFEAVVNIIPPSKVVEHNVFIKDKDATKPMLAAHRGGSMNNPENTLKAYKAAVTDLISTSWKVTFGSLKMKRLFSLTMGQSIE